VRKVVLTSDSNHRIMGHVTEKNCCVGKARGFLFEPLGPHTAPGPNRSRKFSGFLPSTINKHKDLSSSILQVNKQLVSRHTITSTINKYVSKQRQGPRFHVFLSEHSGQSPSSPILVSDFRPSSSTTNRELAWQDGAAPDSGWSRRRFLKSSRLFFLALGM